MKNQIEIPAGRYVRKLRSPVLWIRSRPPRKFDPVAYAAALEILG